MKCGVGYRRVWVAELRLQDDAVLLRRPLQFHLLQDVIAAPILECDSDRQVELDVVPLTWSLARLDRALAGPPRMRFSVNAAAVTPAPAKKKRKKRPDEAVSSDEEPDEDDVSEWVNAPGRAFGGLAAAGRDGQDDASAADAGARCVIVAAESIDRTAASQAARDLEAVVGPAGGEATAQGMGEVVRENLGMDDAARETEALLNLQLAQDIGQQAQPAAPAPPGDAAHHADKHRVLAQWGAAAMQTLKALIEVVVNPVGKDEKFEKNVAVDKHVSLFVMSEPDPMQPHSILARRTQYFHWDSVTGSVGRYVTLDTFNIIVYARPQEKIDISHLVSTRMVSNLVPNTGAKMVKAVGPLRPGMTPAVLTIQHMADSVIDRHRFIQSDAAE
ncbi:unnamed protein product, partial [Prorocentrum cordatum]